MQAPLNALLDELEDKDLLGDPNTTGLSPQTEEELYEAFSSWAEQSGRPLYPHQEEALLELLSGNHVIAQTPTGSGKSLIALEGHFLSMARGGRSYYTAPLKALVSEKFFDLVDAFGASNVGMITGDVALNPQAPIICCTAEILANQALRDGKSLDVDLVIMDEFHFYGDPQRGWAWQIPLLELPQAQFVALSATLGDTTDLQKDLVSRTGRKVSVISDAKRPVPLEFEYCIDELPVVVERLLAENRGPIYIVHFAQREAVNTATSLERLKIITKAQKENIAEELKGELFGRGFGQTLRGLLLQGIGIHHAGMLPRYRRLVERLTQRGLLKVICGTDTLGVGINVPIRTVLFTSLVKFDGTRTRHLSAREFHQIAGRAGRAGFDTVGYVRALGTEAEIEQAKKQARLSAAQEAADKKKLKKLAKKTSKTKGKNNEKQNKVTWAKGTFERLVEAEPEMLRSQFSTTHSLFLNVLSGEGDPEERLLALAEENHEPTQESNPHLRKLGHIYRSLKQADVIDRVSKEQSSADGLPRLRAVRDLPDDFALNQPLAPFALAAFDLLDEESPTFTLDIISVVESVMEDPKPLLFAQQRQERDKAFQAMRAEGLEYDERMEAIAEVSWPKPLEEIIFPAFRVFAQTNPWIGDLEPSPKSVVREMIENATTFSTLVSSYDLNNAEGVILRYLTDTYRALGQIPPARYQTAELDAVISWLGKVVRSVDSSLLDEWEKLSSGVITNNQETATNANEEETAFGTDSEGNITYDKNPYALAKGVRKKVFERIELLSNDAVEKLAKQDSDSGWDEKRWDVALARYWAEYDWIGIDHRASSPELFHLNQMPEIDDLCRVIHCDPDNIPLTEGNDHNWWVAEQIIFDPEEDGDWRLTMLVDVPASKTNNYPVLRMIDFAPQ